MKNIHPNILQLAPYNKNSRRDSSQFTQLHIKFKKHASKSNVAFFQKYTSFRVQPVQQVAVTGGRGVPKGEGCLPKWRGYLPVGCLPRGRGVSALGRCLLGGCLAGGVMHPPPPVDRMRDTCKNIILPQLRCGR